MPWETLRAYPEKGKLPCETISASYDLEYGCAEIEMHKDSIKPGQRVILVDDLIATGGLLKPASVWWKNLEEKLQKLFSLWNLQGLREGTSFPDMMWHPS